jgi:hypothetical protein
MPRILVALLALFSISGVVYADTTPAPTLAVHAALFPSARPDNHFFRSLAARGSAQSTPAALTCCKACSVGKACGNT